MTCDLGTRNPGIVVQISPIDLATTTLHCSCICAYSPATSIRTSHGNAKPSTRRKTDSGLTAVRKTDERMLLMRVSRCRFPGALGVSGASTFSWLHSRADAVLHGL